MEPVAESDMNASSPTPAWEKTIMRLEDFRKQRRSRNRGGRMVFPFWTFISVEILIWAAKRSAHLKDCGHYNIRRKTRSVREQHRQTHTYAKRARWECAHLQSAAMNVREGWHRHTHRSLQKKVGEVSQVLTPLVDIQTS